MLPEDHNLSVGSLSIINELFVESSFCSAVYTGLYGETDPGAIAKCHLWKGIGAVVTLAVSAVVLFFF